MCGPWSQVQDLNAVTPAGKRALAEKRSWHLRNVLGFAKKVFNKQVQSGRYAHLEHPRTAKSWKTRAFQGLLAKYWVDFDQCEYGLNVDGTGLNKKPTRVATNKKVMCNLERTCSGDHYHVPLLGGTRTKAAEDYPPQLAVAIAMMMACDDHHVEGDVDILDVDVEDMTVDPDVPADTDGAQVMDDAVYTGRSLVDRMDALKHEVGERVFKYVRKLHNGLGHPSAPVLDAHA